MARHNAVGDQRSVVTIEIPPVRSGYKKNGYHCAMPSASRKSRKGVARLISSKTVFQGPVFSVVSDRVKEPGGVRARRDVVRHCGSIVVLAVDKMEDGRKRVLLERQYRYAAGERLWELPAGRVDPGEGNLEAARRELLEETGFTARKWQKALFFYASPGFLDETMEVFLAQDLKKGLAQPEEDERIAIRFFPLTQAVAMAMKGKIKDAKTIAALLWLDRKFSERSTTA
jgi:ADP-ribose pyrophosphatase